MKRFLIALAMSSGFMVASITSASAYYCQLDPLVPLGTPITYSVKASVTVLGTTSTTSLSGTKTYQDAWTGLGY